MSGEYGVLQLLGISTKRREKQAESRSKYFVPIKNVSEEGKIKNDENDNVSEKTPTPGEIIGNEK